MGAAESVCFVDNESFLSVRKRINLCTAKVKNDKYRH